MISMEESQTSPIMQQIGMLNLRINDMMTQLNSTLKTVLDENSALKKENDGLRAKEEKANKP